MRVVLDTNVLARTAYRPKGPAAEVLDRLSRPPHLLVLSGFVLAELQRVLHYPRLRQLHRLRDEDIALFVEKLGTDAVVVELPSESVAVARDPDDDSIIATAVAGQADVLCTLDRHLFAEHVQAYCRQRGIEIMDDVQLLARLRSEEE